MPAPRKIEVHPILMGLESHLHSRTIFRLPTARNFGSCRAVVATSGCNCPASCPAAAGEKRTDAEALRYDLATLTAISDKEQLYRDVVAFTELTYCGRHRGKKTLVEGLARWKAELDELEVEPCPTSSSDDTVVSVFADTEDVSMVSAAQDSGAESDGTEASLVQEDEGPREEDFKEESDGEASGEDYSMAIDRSFVVRPVEAMPYMALPEPAKSRPSARNSSPAADNFAWKYSATPEPDDNATTSRARSWLSILGFAAMTPPAEHSDAGFKQPTLAHSITDQQAFEEMVNVELHLTKQPDFPPEVPAVTADNALSLSDGRNADADDNTSVLGSESSFEDVFEDVEETRVEETASPVAYVSANVPWFNVPGAFPEDDDAAVAVPAAAVDEASVVVKVEAASCETAPAAPAAHEAPSSNTIEALPKDDHVEIKEEGIPQDIAAVETASNNNSLSRPTESLPEIDTVVKGEQVPCDETAREPEVDVALLPDNAAVPSDSTQLVASEDTPVHEADDITSALLQDGAAPPSMVLPSKTLPLVAKHCSCGPASESSGATIPASLSLSKIESLPDEPPAVAEQDTGESSRIFKDALPTDDKKPITSGLQSLKELPVDKTPALEEPERLATATDSAAPSQPPLALAGESPLAAEDASVHAASPTFDEILPRRHSSSSAASTTKEGLVKKAGRAARVIHDKTATMVKRSQRIAETIKDIKGEFIEGYQDSNTLQRVNTA